MTEDSIQADSGDAVKAEKSPDTFKIGDVVKLKSGGPEMTITNMDDSFSIISDDAASCDWFDDAGVHFTREFPLTCLKSPYSVLKYAADEERPY